MDTETKELISIGSACVANCVPRLEYHVEKGREAGFADDEIREAINVERMVKRGAARKWDESAAGLLGPGAGG